MIVYLETNFLFELATGRDKNDHCLSLLEWSRRQQIALRIPVTVFTETRTALRRRAAIQLGVARDLGDQYRDSERLRDTEIARVYETAESHLKSAAKTEKEKMQAVSAELFQIATLLPLNRENLTLSERFRALEVLSGDGDLLIFASIVHDLELRNANGDAAPSVFVTGDADFGNVKKFLRPYSCDLLTSYSAAVARLKGQLA